MRLLANLVSYGLISVEAFCQFLLTLVEDYIKLGITQVDGAQSHSADLILETVLAALPQTQQKLQKEQSIDFGTVLESLKQIYRGREKTASHSEATTDLLVKTWEATF